MKKLLYTAAAAVVLAATPAFAHTGTGAHAAGFAHGFAHPFGGLDHLLAMVAVGVWSALAMPKRVWLAPLAFVIAMLAGAAFAAGGIALPMLETGIVASVIALGVMIALRVDAGPVAGAALVGAFALFHGNAHGLEATGAMAGYMAGFTAATVLLHAAGVAIGHGLLRQQGVIRFAGSAVAAAGLLLMAT